MSSPSSRRKSHSLPKTKSQTWLVLADTHAPNYSRPTLRCVLDFASRVRLDGVVFLGDQFSNDCISHHTAGRPLLRGTGTFRKETLLFDREILTPLERVLPPGCRKIWIRGNHDTYTDELVEISPELKGTLDRELALNLKTRGWKVLEEGEHFRHGKLTYIHGETLSGSYHSKKAVETYCCNLVYGHFHAPQSFTKVLPNNHSQKWSAVCLPILGDVHAGYLKNKPTGWTNGFGVVQYHGSERSFNLYTVVVTNGRCAYGGKVYSAQPRRAS